MSGIPEWCTGVRSCKEFVAPLGIMIPQGAMKTSMG